MLGMLDFYFIYFILYDAIVGSIIRLYPSLRVYLSMEASGSLLLVFRGTLRNGP